MKLLSILLICISSFSLHANEVESSANVLLSASLDLKNGAIRASKGNDIWGWTDSATKKEYVIMGLNSKASFVDVTNPARPIHLADLKTATRSSTWRDIKIYKHYAFIVSEAYSHGMQVFNLRRLRRLNGESVVTMEADARYTNFGNAHNIFINEETGYGYAVGTSTCDGGLHIVDLRKPLKPKFVNCVGRGVYEIPRAKGPVGTLGVLHGDAYTHDV